MFVFVISDVFASFLGTLIEFPWPESWYTIARVSELDLGLCLNGKIGLWDLYQCVRNDPRNRTMALEFIYIMYAGFLMFARDIASKNGRRWKFKYLKRRRWSLARRRKQWKGNACIIHSLRFQTVEHASSVGQGVGFQSLRVRSPVRTMLGPIFYKVWFSFIFSYFSYYFYYFNILHAF